MDGAVFPPCYLTWGQTMVEVMKIMATSFKRSHALSAPHPAAGHRWPRPLPHTPRHSGASLAQSLVGSVLLSPGSWCIQGFVCALPESVTQFCVSSGRSMVGLMATSFKRSYSIPRSTAPRALSPQQSTADPCPPGDTQTQFCLSLCGVSVSWCTQGLFEPSEHFWQLWGLILNAILPLLPSSWGFSFALGGGVSLPSHPSATQLPLQCHTGFNSMWTVNFQMFKLDLEKAEEPEIQLPASVGSSKKQEIPVKHLFLLYWPCQSLWLCGSQQTVENSERVGNTRPPDLPLWKLVCRSGSNS